MIHLHCTQKLLAKLPLDERGQLRSRKKAGPAHRPGIDASIENPLSGWHANLLVLQRRNCVLFVHDATRFPLFIPCLQKADFAALDWHFTDVLMNTLLKVGADDAMLQRAHALLAPLVCDNDCNRSVQGTLNQMAMDLEFHLHHDQSAVTDLLPYSTSARLANRPCTVKGVKGCIWPVDAMLALLR